MTKRTVALVLSAALVVAAIGAIPPSGLATPAPPDGALHAVDGQDGNGTATAEDDAVENDSDRPPGAVLSAAVSVQSAELDGEIDRRAFGIRIARAASNESRADVVADRLADVEARIAALEQRKQELERARENGTIGTATYDAEMTELTARAANVRGLANQSEAVARGLPADVLERKGINVTAIRTLQQNASELSGPETAAVARSIAGPDVGQPVAGDRTRGSGNAPHGAGPDVPNNETTGNAPTDVGDGSAGNDGAPGLGDGDSDDEDGDDVETPGES